ncbi:uncharacterized protein TNIN_279431 [Trichonephila inaurata madagascariensis]|uniref:Gustatory receptor n=1 Tax=Trichonephila inaurata madagascariensis TaxID=2747483 RepID=A0A8X6IPG6_9ARAC|nr:uncharacterized protein TNIN_279431 [Trichonephila inaurata madagascariensis]
MTLHSLRRKKNNLRNVLRMLEKLSPAIHNRKTNIMVLVLFSFSFIYSATTTLGCNIKRVSVYYAYGHELKSPKLQATIIFIKAFLLFFSHTTFPSLVGVLFCSLCLKCSSCFNYLTQKVHQYSPEEFGPSEQIDILRQKAKVDIILEKLHDIFSLPSFLVILSNLLTCCVALGMTVIGLEARIKIIKALIYGIANSVSLIVVLWVAGELPMEQNRLKNAFYKRAHSRFLMALSSKESQCKREILDKPNFVFSGCNIFSYTRNSVLTLVGTLLTYTLIIYKL